MARMVGRSWAEASEARRKMLVVPVGLGRGVAESAVAEGMVVMVGAVIAGVWFGVDLGLFVTPCTLPMAWWTRFVAFKIILSHFDRAAEEFRHSRTCISDLVTSDPVERRE